MSWRVNLSSNSLKINNIEIGETVNQKGFTVFYYSKSRRKNKRDEKILMAEEEIK